MNTPTIRRPRERSVRPVLSKLCSLLFCASCLTACGASSFKGKIEAPPGWVATELSAWSRPLDLGRVDRVIYGRGATSAHELISERRARAEAQAVNDAKRRCIEHVKAVIGMSEADLIAEVEQLSWVQIALPVERFFDPEKNTQYVLVQVTRDQLKRHLQFKLRTTSDPNARAIVERLLAAADKLFVKA